MHRPSHNNRTVLSSGQRSVICILLQGGRNFAARWRRGAHRCTAQLARGRPPLTQTSSPPLPSRAATGFSRMRRVPPRPCARRSPGGALNAFRGVRHEKVARRRFRGCAGEGRRGVGGCIVGRGGRRGAGQGCSCANMRPDANAVESPFLNDAVASQLGVSLPVTWAQRLALSRGQPLQVPAGAGVSTCSWRISPSRWRCAVADVAANARFFNTKIFSLDSKSASSPFMEEFSSEVGVGD